MTIGHYQEKASKVKNTKQKKQSKDNNRADINVNNYIFNKNDHTNNFENYDNMDTRIKRIFSLTSGCSFRKSKLYFSWASALFRLSRNSLKSSDKICGVGFICLSKFELVKGLDNIAFKLLLMKAFVDNDDEARAFEFFLKLKVSVYVIRDCFLKCLLLIWILNAELLKFTPAAIWL